MGKLKEAYTNRMIDFLAKEGERLILECINEVDYTHDTNNLADSYGYGVYLNGRIVKSGFANQIPNANKPRKWYRQEVWGRTRIQDFLNKEYKPQGYLDLVLAAAMPYGHALENASSGQKRKYRVISMSYDKLRNLSAKFKGSSVFHISNSTATL